MSRFRRGDRVRVDREGYGYYSGTSDAWPIERQTSGLHDWDGTGVVEKAMDNEGDVDVILPFGRSIYVRPAFVTRIEEKEDNDVDTESEPEVDGVWVSWSGSTFVAFSEEIEALRYAVQNSYSAMRLAYGEELVI